MKEALEKIRLKLIRKLLRVLNFGFKKTQRTASLGDFKGVIIAAPTWKPIFVLSPGRSGTAWLSEFFRKIDSTWVAHSHAPEFIGQGRFAYDLLMRRGLDTEILSVLGQMYLAGREDVMLGCYERSLQFIETNNRVTFLCWSLARLFPNARFIHLTRNPIDFVQSGMSRGWYELNDGHDHGRLRPIAGSNAAELWGSWDQVQKIAWLWSETNSFVMKFSASEFRKQCFTVCLEDLLADRSTRESLVKFCGLAMPKVTFDSSRVVNQQKHRDSSRQYFATNDGESKVLKIAGKVAKELGYI